MSHVFGAHELDWKSEVHLASSSQSSALKAAVGCSIMHVCLTAGFGVPLCSVVQSSYTRVSVAYMEMGWPHSKSSLLYAVSLLL